MNTNSSKSSFWHACIALSIWPILWFLFQRENLWRTALTPLAAPGQAPLFERVSLLDAAYQHLNIVLTAMLGVIVIALPLAIWITRRSGQRFLPLVLNVVSIGQVFPPVAVLFLCIPIFGFGERAVIFALFMYGLLPSVQGILSGLQNVAANVRDAADGMGMGAAKKLWRIELPLAIPASLAGLRSSLVLLVATASLAPMVGGISLGTPIIAGLSVNNSAQVLEGALAVAFVALACDYSMRVLESCLTPWR